MFNPFSWIKNIFTKVKPTINAFLAQVFHATMQAFVAKLWETAVEATKEVSLQDLTNAEKRKAVVKRITEVAKENGIEYKEHMLNLLTEMAVAYWKSLNTK